MTCTFFGHRNISGDIKENLCEVVTDLIERESVTKFYVGNEGGFDCLAAR